MAYLLLRWGAARPGAFARLWALSSFTSKNLICTQTSADVHIASDRYRYLFRTIAWREGSG